jgi:hypothetical protein
MFVSFTKTLKKMSGFRLGFGVRVNKRNALLWCFAMLFAGMFYLMWYMIIGAGWCLYFFLWAFYKIYYYLFKGIAVGCKSNRRRNEPNKKTPVQGSKARTGDCSLCGGRLKGEARSAARSITLCCCRYPPECRK